MKVTAYICRMPTFFRTKTLMAATSLLLLLATVLSMPRRRQADTEEHSSRGPLVSVAFRNATGRAGSKFSMVIHRRLGMEFRAYLLGSEQVLVAHDDRAFWFWVRSYDPKRYYFCPLKDAEKVGLVPVFHPLFVRCVSGVEFVWSPHPKDGVMNLEDGEYEVTVLFVGGLATRQVYYRQGVVEAFIEFVEYQPVAGAMLPKKVSVGLKGQPPQEIDMGQAETGEQLIPQTAPPEGMKGLRLEAL